MRVEVISKTKGTLGKKISNTLDLFAWNLVGIVRHSPSHINYFLKGKKGNKWDLLSVSSGSSETLGELRQRGVLKYVRLSEIYKGGQQHNARSVDVAQVLFTRPVGVHYYFSRLYTYR